MEWYWLACRALSLTLLPLVRVLAFALSDLRRCRKWLNQARRRHSIKRRNVATMAAWAERKQGR